MKIVISIMLAFCMLQGMKIKAQTDATLKEQLLAYEQQLRPNLAQFIGQSGYSIATLRVLVADNAEVDYQYDFLRGNDYLILALSDTQEKLNFERYRPEQVKINQFDGSEYVQERKSLDTATGMMTRRKLFETENVQREGLLINVPKELSQRPVILVIGYRSKDNKLEDPAANFPENYYLTK
jgi:hypothetical protein